MTGEDPVLDRNALFDWGAPPPSVAAPRRRAPVRLLVALPVVLSLGLGLGPLVPRAWYDQQAYDETYGLGRYAHLLTPQQRAAVASATSAAAAFVAQRRGRPFPAVVRVHLLPDADFVDVLHRNSVDGGRLSSDAEHALGLASPAATQDTSLVSGFYDPGSSTVFVRGTRIDDSSTSVLVHEMTHAFDDRYLDLSQLPDTSSDSPDDVADAATALVEGEAADVQLAWIEAHALSPCAVAVDQELPVPAGCDDHDDRKRTSADYEQPADAAVQDFPYWAGVRFVRALRAAGGNNAVDAAFRDPPMDTAQVLEPALYLGHVRPERVPAPSVRARTEPEGALGALGVSLAVTDGVLDVAGSRYLRGWAGDTSLSYRAGARRCLADRLRLRTAALASTAAARFSSWATRKPHRTSRRLGSRDVVFTSCT